VPAPALAQGSIRHRAPRKFQKEGRRRASQSGNSLQEPQRACGPPGKGGISPEGKQWGVVKRVPWELGDSSPFYQTRKGSDTVEQRPDTPELTWCEQTSQKEKTPRGRWPNAMTSSKCAGSRSAGKRVTEDILWINVDFTSENQCLRQELLALAQYSFFQLSAGIQASRLFEPGPYLIYDRLVGILERRSLDSGLDLFASDVERAEEIVLKEMSYCDLPN
jgi:hypothetical protein